MRPVCFASQTRVTAPDTTSRRDARRHRRINAAASVNIHSGAAANSFANTPIADIHPARLTRLRHNAIVVTAPSMYISGSDVKGSNSEYSDPVPSAHSHIAARDADAEIPTSAQKRPTASAALAFAITAYAFHFGTDGPGRCSSTAATSGLKQ